MAGRSYLLLDGRGVIAIAGEDGRGLLQGLISNDIEKVAENHAIYAALLTPQGRFLHDFFVAQAGEALMLDCEGARRADLLRRLTLYRLRAKATLDDVSESLTVAVLFGNDAPAALGFDAEEPPGTAKPFASGCAFVDPRHSAAGLRAILPREGAAAAIEAAGFTPGDPADYERLRLSLALPDGSRDLPVEQALLMENRFEVLNGLDWDKGCYVGQELTARMKYRALIKKELVAVEIDGPALPPGTPIMADGKEVGELRSSHDGLGLALLRRDAIEGGAALAAGESQVTVREPGA